MRTIFYKLCTITLLFLINHAAHAIDLNRLLGPAGGSKQYEFTWDGWRGTLTLNRPSSFTNLSPAPSGRLPVGSGTLRQLSNGRVRQVKYWLGAANESFCIEVGRCFEHRRGLGYGSREPGKLHRIALIVDFANTPTNLTDDQIYDGYVYTRTSNGFAGITWWPSNILPSRSIPFAFSAKQLVRTILPIPPRLSP